MAFLTKLGDSALPFLVAVYAGLFFGGAFAKYGLYAALIHEIGHIIVYFVIKKQFPKVSVRAGGMSIRLPALSVRLTALLLIAGVAANLLVAAVTGIIMIDSPSYSGYFILITNLVVAAFNLLPLSFSDGGRLLTLFSPTWFLPILDNIFVVMSALLIAGLFYILLINESPVLQISLIGIIIIVTIRKLEK